MDITPNKAMALEVIAPPTINVSIAAAGGSFLPTEIWSDSYSVKFTQDHLPIIWPHLHMYEMNTRERQVLHNALRTSVKFVGVGNSV